MRPTFWALAEASRQVRISKLSLPWIHSRWLHAFLFAAKELGYWNSRGLNVQVDRGFGSGETCKRVALGQYDYGLADFATMVKFADDGLPLTCIGMVSHVSQLGILSLKEAGIAQPKDLEGKTMGTTAGSADYALWPEASWPRRASTPTR